MRRRVALFAVALLLVACAAITPLTPELRDEVAAAPEGLAGRSFQLLGEFELQTSGRATIIVKHRAKVMSISASDDSTIVATVLGAQVSGLYDTLRLTFMESRADGGSYTLRAINGAPLGSQIPIGIVGYQYVPCYQNVGTKCMEPIAAGAREDQRIKLALVK